MVSNQTQQQFEKAWWKDFTILLNQYENRCSSGLSKEQPQKEFELYEELSIYVNVICCIPHDPRLSMTAVQSRQNMFTNQYSSVPEEVTDELV